MSVWRAVFNPWNKKTSDYVPITRGWQCFSWFPVRSKQASTQLPISSSISLRTHNNPNRTKRHCVQLPHKSNETSTFSSGKLEMICSTPRGRRRHHNLSSTVRIPTHTGRTSQTTPRHLMLQKIENDSGSPPGSLQGLLGYNSEISRSIRVSLTCPTLSLTKLGR